jgi:hypothetical protein
VRLNKFFQYCILTDWDQENDIRGTITKKCSELLSLFDNPRSVIDKRSRKLFDHSRVVAMKNKSDKNIDEHLLESSKAFVMLTEQLLEELPKFRGGVQKYFNAVLSCCEQLLYHSKHTKTNILGHLQSRKFRRNSIRKCRSS